MNRMGVLVGRFELNPKEDQFVRGSSFLSTPKRYHVLCLPGLYCLHSMTAFYIFFFSHARLSETLKAKDIVVLLKCIGKKLFKKIKPSLTFSNTYSILTCLGKP